MIRIAIIDNFLAHPEPYRKNAVAHEFQGFEFPGATFHGIAPIVSPVIPLLIRSHFPDLEAHTLTFFRRSPLGQSEPNFIHTDVDMGRWTGLLYLNPDPPAGDGTAFWRHKATGEIASPIPHLRSREGDSKEPWDMREFVEAKFNRLLVFDSSLYHSRAIHANWGDENEARLLQVTFGGAPSV